MRGTFGTCGIFGPRCMADNLHITLFPSQKSESVTNLSSGRVPKCRYFAPVLKQCWSRLQNWGDLDKPLWGPFESAMAFTEMGFRDQDSESKRGEKVWRKKVAAFCHSLNLTMSVQLLGVRFFLCGRSLHFLLVLRNLTQSGIAFSRSFLM